MRYHFTATRMVIKKVDRNKFEKDVGRGKPAQC